MPRTHTAPVLLRLTPRSAYWRVAVITPGRILWRTYSREAYPEADAVLERCLAGLVPQQQRQGHREPNADEGSRPDVHSAPPSGLPAAGRQTEIAEDSAREEIQQVVRHPAPPAGRRGRPRPRRLRVAWWGWL